MQDTGNVNIQDIKIFRITLKFNAPIPRASPTPKTAPTNTIHSSIGHLFRKIKNHDLNNSTVSFIVLFFNSSKELLSNIDFVL